MVFKNYFCSLMLIAFFIGCENNPAEPNDSKDVIMPLDVGNQWTYLSVLNYGTPDTLIMEIRRQIRVSHDGERLPASTWIFYPKGKRRPDFEWLAWNGPNGFYSLGGIAETDTFLVKTLQLKFPAQVGDSWPVLILGYSLSDDQFYVADTLTYSLVAKDEEFETPVGKFKCHVYKYSEKPAEDVLEFWDYYNYYSPGIGLVGLVVKGQFDGRILSKLSLLSYDVR